MLGSDTQGLSRTSEMPAASGTAAAGVAPMLSGAPPVFGPGEVLTVGESEVKASSLSTSAGLRPLLSKPLSSSSLRNSFSGVTQVSAGAKGSRVRCVQENMPGRKAFRSNCEHHSTL